MQVESSPGYTHGAAGAKMSLLFRVMLSVVFLLVLMAVGWSLAREERNVVGGHSTHEDLIMIGFLGFGLVIIALDVFVPRKSLSAIAGLFFGLVVGMVIAYGLSLVIDLLIEANFGGVDLTGTSQESLVSALKLALGVVC